ncbi:hypothetical protein [Streptomyces sp. NRRL F-5123]|nr:hypothetical protein [Streptomyces sp. NRRL F-5123]
MKLLLTSAGVKNPGIRQTLVDLLGKPVEQAEILHTVLSGFLESLAIT